MSERFPIATHHKKRLYVPEKRMYQLWTPRYNQGVGTLYLIPIEMPMGPRSNIPPISMMEVTLSSTSTHQIAIQMCTQLYEHTLVSSIFKK